MLKITRKTTLISFLFFFQLITQTDIQASFFQHYETCDPADKTYFTYPTELEQAHKQTYTPITQEEFRSKMTQAVQDYKQSQSTLRAVRKHVFKKAVFLTVLSIGWLIGYNKQKNPAYIALYCTSLAGIYAWKYLCIRKAQAQHTQLASRISTLAKDYLQTINDSADWATYFDLPSVELSPSLSPEEKKQISSQLQNYLETQPEETKELYKNLRKNILTLEKNSPFGLSEQSEEFKQIKKDMFYKQLLEAVNTRITKEIILNTRI